MTENTGETERSALSSDDQLIARAMEIRQKSGVSLTDAMAQAEEERVAALDASELKTSFTITLHVKPRVARWILATFGGHAKFTVEERLAAYLVQLVNRFRVQAIRRSEPAPEIPKGGEAVTLRREHMSALGH